MDQTELQKLIAYQQNLTQYAKIILNQKMDLDNHQVPVESFQNVKDKENMASTAGRINSAKSMLINSTYTSKNLSLEMKTLVIWK